MTPDQFHILNGRFDTLTESVNGRFGYMEKQFQALNGRFDSFVEFVDKRFEKIDARFDNLEDDVRAVSTKIDDVRDEVLGFASDVHDRLSTRIDSVVAFVGMPKPPVATADEE